MSSVTVVIPHWNRLDLIVPALKRLIHQTHPIHEILVVDDGSTDGSAEAAESLGARVLRMGRNTGFAKAVNRGIDQCETELVSLINNDVEAAPDWLARLVAEFANPSVWFATGKILDANRSNILDGAFDLLSKGACAWRAGSQRLDGEHWNERRDILFASGTAAVFRKELFRRVGGLDEGFGSYLEDVEFGLRCATAGYRGVYVPDAVVFHQGSATLGAWSPEKVRLIARNQLLLVARHYPKNWLWLYGWKILIGQGFWGVVALRHGAGTAYVRGKWQGLRLFREMRRDLTNPDRLRAVLDESERMIYQMQRRCGFDAYWRWYFSLTS
jgi:GT2 family glycosyltransferase